LPNLKFKLFKGINKLIAQNATAIDKIKRTRKLTLLRYHFCILQENWRGELDYQPDELDQIDNQF